MFFYFHQMRILQWNHILFVTTTVRLVCEMWDTEWDFCFYYKEYAKYNNFMIINSEVSFISFKIL